MKLNWTYINCNSSREIPRYICIYFVKLKTNFFKFFSFLFLKFFSLLFSFKIPNYSPITLQLSFSYIFMIFFQLGEKNCFSFFLFLFLFFSFLFLVLLSYFLLKSSNTPLLFLNFHFHFTITLQKKKRERSPTFKLDFIYISKFGVCVFVFKYFISKSLTSMLNF